VAPRSGVLCVDRACERGGEKPLVVAVGALLGRRRRLRSKVVGVDDDPAPRPLCFIKGDVSLADQHVGALEAGRLGNPTGEGKAGLVTKRLTLQPLSERECTPSALVSEQHHELVTADPIRRVGRADRRAEAIAEGAEADVAGLVAKRVVDLLEAVEVDHHDAEAGSRASTARDLTL
jgi:hypothetical protein